MTEIEKGKGRGGELWGGRKTRRHTPWSQTGGRGKNISK